MRVATESNFEVEERTYEGHAKAYKNFSARAKFNGGYISAIHELICYENRDEQHHKIGIFVELLPNTQTIEAEVTIEIWDESEQRVELFRGPNFTKIFEYGHTNSALGEKLGVNLRPESAITVRFTISKWEVSNRSHPCSA